jgi:hypothetical protein
MQIFSLVGGHAVDILNDDESIMVSIPFGGVFDEKGKPIAFRNVELYPTVATVGVDGIEIPVKTREIVGNNADVSLANIPQGVGVIVAAQAVSEIKSARPGLTVYTIGGAVYHMVEGKSVIKGCKFLILN